MEYVEHQVRLILATAAAERDPMRHSTAREAAAKKLVEAFIALAAAEGLQRSVNAHNEPCFAISGSLAVRILTDGGGGIYVRIDGWGGSSTPVKQVDLSFDYVGGTFVGNEPDHDIAPSPGAPLPRVDPLIAIARTIASELAQVVER